MSYLNTKGERLLMWHYVVRMHYVVIKLEKTQRKKEVETAQKDNQNRLNLIESALKTCSVPVLIHPQPDLPASGANVERA